jgi:hypothetical protein
MAVSPVGATLGRRDLASPVGSLLQRSHERHGGGDSAGSHITTAMQRRRADDGSAMVAALRDPVLYRAGLLHSSEGADLVRRTREYRTLLLSHGRALTSSFQAWFFV